MPIVKFVYFDAQVWNTHQHVIKMKIWVNKNQFWELLLLKTNQLGDWSRQNTGSFSFDLLMKGVINNEHRSTCISLANAFISLANICISPANTCISLADTCISLANTCISLTNTCISPANTCISQAKGELTRLLLAAGNIDYEDFRWIWFYNMQLHFHLYLYFHSEVDSVTQD